MIVDRNDVEKTRESVKKEIENRRQTLEYKIQNIEHSIRQNQHSLEERRKELEGMREVEAFAEWSLGLWEKNLKDAEEAEKAGDITALGIANNSLARHEKGFGKIKRGWSKFRDLTWDGIWAKKTREGL